MSPQKIRSSGREFDAARDQRPVFLSLSSYSALTADPSELTAGVDAGSHLYVGGDGAGQSHPRNISLAKRPVLHLSRNRSPLDRTEEEVQSIFPSRQLGPVPCALRRENEEPLPHLPLCHSPLATSRFAAIQDVHVAQACLRSEQHLAGNRCATLYTRPK